MYEYAHKIPVSFMFAMTCENFCNLPGEMVILIGFQSKPSTNSRRLILQWYV